MLSLYLVTKTDKLTVVLQSLESSSSSSSSTDLLLGTMVSMTFGEVQL